MKFCGGYCKQELPFSAFSFKNKEKGLYSSYCRECNKRKNKEHYQANKSYYKEKKMAYEALNGGRQAMRHNLSPDILAEMYGKYNGACWICKTRPATVVDHDHKCCPTKDGSCGKCARGVLCSSCNSGIGLLGDDLNSLIKAVEYLTTCSMNMQM